jgi:hypothetical protein
MAAIDPYSFLETTRSLYEALSLYFQKKAQQLSFEATRIQHELSKGHQPDLKAIREEFFEAQKNKATHLTEESTIRDKLSENVERGSSLMSIPVIMRAIAEINEIFTHPNPASAAILAVTPPPVMLAIYAVVGLFNIVKLGLESAKALECQRQIMFGDKTEQEIKELTQERNKALMNMLQATLALGVAAAMITSIVFAPGAANIAAVAFLGVSVAVGAARFMRGAKEGAKTIEDIEKTADLSKNLETAHFGKALTAYISARFNMITAEKTEIQEYKQAALERQTIIVPPIETGKPLNTADIAKPQ